MILLLLAALLVVGIFQLPIAFEFQMILVVPILAFQWLLLQGVKSQMRHKRAWRSFSIVQRRKPEAREKAVRKIMRLFNVPLDPNAEHFEQTQKALLDSLVRYNGRLRKKEDAVDAANLVRTMTDICAEATGVTIAEMRDAVWSQWTSMRVDMLFETDGKRYEPNVEKSLGAALVRSKREGKKLSLDEISQKLHQ